MSTTTDGGRERWQRVCAVLDAVFDAPESQRKRVLDQHCAGDDALRAEVEAMLAAEATTDVRVDTPAAEWAGEMLDAPEADPAEAHAAGEMIGDYRLVRELGRGGMGSVWLAERESGGFSQQVALKLLKRGLDTDAVLRRFYEERRILARLHHPHIALFIDGGVSVSGQPWFTMEWVDGAPITQWCDARKLGIRERVALFLDAVAAVQYAHQQLIVHRDLKPGNVLVSESGEVKLLDFGIAKMLDATEGIALDATMTRMGLRMLTPAYAAPEQLRGDAATTATDVYALGVLLYELLAGKRPASKSRDATDAPVPRPSSQVDEAAAALRDTGLERLRRQLRGDLDTIVLKAMNGEASRRYGSAQSFGEDLQRWLDGQPVQARPDSAWYRTRRFIGRHRLGTAAAVVMVVSLTAGALIAAWQAREANLQAQEARRQALEAEKQTKRAEEVKEFLVGIFQAGNPREWKGKDATARDLLEIGAKRVDEELRDDPMLRAQMQRVIGEIALSQDGNSDRAESLLRASMQEVRRLAGENSKDYADALHSWAVLLDLKGDYEGSIRAVEREIAIRRRDPGDYRKTAQALGMLANLRERGEAIELRREAVALLRHTPEGEDSLYAEHVLVLGLLLVDARRFDEAARMLDESLKISRKLYGPDSVQFAVSLNGRGRLLSETGDLPNAAVAYRDAASIFGRAKSSEDLVIARLNQGDALCRMGRFSEAERSFHDAQEVQKRFTAAHWINVRNLNRGKCLSDAGEYGRADPLLRELTTGGAADGHELERDFALIAASQMLRLRVRQGNGSEAVAMVGSAEDRLGPIRGSDGWQSAQFLAAAAPALFMEGDRGRGLQSLRSALQDMRRQNAPARTIDAATLDLSELEVQNGEGKQVAVRLRRIEGKLDGGAQGPLGLRARLIRGVALMLNGNLEEAKPLLRQVIEERRKMYGDDSVLTGEARLYLGVCLHRAGERERGRELIERGREQFTGESSPTQFVVRLADRELRRSQSQLMQSSGRRLKT